MSLISRVCHVNVLRISLNRDRYRQEFAIYIDCGSMSREIPIRKINCQNVGMHIQYCKYGSDEILICSRSGKIGSIYEVGKGIPNSLFGGSATTLAEWDSQIESNLMGIESLIEHLNIKGYLMTDLISFTKEQLLVTLREIEVVLKNKS
eukprot:NODE_679_length_4801_cov_0.851978.p6 type:complete len:149 gc:universal NODE_679_length_4801_cov_0.851978:1664-2110(+)